MISPTPALVRRWYKKLKKVGFDDIEQDTRNLKIYHSHYFMVKYFDLHRDGDRWAGSTSFRAKASYYRLASAFTHSHNFKDKKEKLIWSLHSDGVAMVNIRKILAEIGQKTYIDGVRKTINRLSSIMLKEAATAYDESWLYPFIG
jgi:hypothetical protein